MGEFRSDEMGGLTGGVRYGAEPVLRGMHLFPEGCGTEDSLRVSKPASFLAAISSIRNEWSLVFAGKRGMLNVGSNCELSVMNPRAKKARKAYNRR